MVTESKNLQQIQKRQRERNQRPLQNHQITKKKNKRRKKNGITEQSEINEQNGNKCVAINNHLSVNRLNIPISGHRMAEWVKQQQQQKSIYILSIRDSLQKEGHTQTESKVMEKTFHTDRNQKKARVAIPSYRQNRL